MKRNAINILLLLLLTAGTAVAIFWGEDLENIIEILSQANMGWCAVGLLFVIVFICTESVIIYMLIRATGHRCKLTHGFMYSFIGFFFCAITPSATGGQPTQIYYMKKDGIPVSVSLPVLTVVTILYKGVLILTGIAVFIVRPAGIMELIDPIKFWCVLGFSLETALLALLLLIIYRPDAVRGMANAGVTLYTRVFRRKEPAKIREMLEEWMQKYSNVAGCFRREWGVILAAFVLTVFQRYLLFSVTYLTCRAFGIPSGGLGTVMVLQAMIATASDIMPLPGGTGAYESMFINVFTGILGEEMVLPVMLLSRGTSYYAQLILGGLVTAFAIIYFRRKKIVIPVMPRGGKKSK